MYNGSAHTEYGYRDNGRLAEAVTASDCHQTENTDGQIGKAHLQLKQIPRRPTDRFGNDIG